MKKFEGTIPLGNNGRIFAHCYTSRIELCGERPTYLFILDAEQEDDLGLPLVIYQQDIRLVKSLASIKQKIRQTMPDAFKRRKKINHEELDS